MSLDTVIVTGNLKADGTLELDERPPLAPGRVRVVIVPTPTPSGGGPRRTILDVLDEIHAAQAARGYHGRSIEEMEADLAQQRAEDEEYEERWRTLGSQTTPSPPQGKVG